MRRALLITLSLVLAGGPLAACSYCGVAGHREAGMEGAIRGQGLAQCSG